MTDTTETGVPYPSEMAGPVDEWSAQIYAALRDWPIARTGEWTRWEPGYLLLTITHVDDSEMEPIVLYSADEELTVAFGCREIHNPVPYELLDAEANVIAEHAKLLVEQWLIGKIRTAVLTDATGNGAEALLLSRRSLRRNWKLLRGGYATSIRSRWKSAHLTSPIGRPTLSSHSG